MKKVVVFITILSFVFMGVAFMGCGKEEPIPTPTPKPVIHTPTPAPTPVAVPDKDPGPPAQLKKGGDAPKPSKLVPKKGGKKK